MTAEYDLIINGGAVLVESDEHPRLASLAIRAGQIIAISTDPFPVENAITAIDGHGRWVLPGAIDSHVHFGIYRGLGEDVESETRAAAAGGTTSIISYFRTGSHYLDRSGPYREIFPEVLAAAAGRAHVDYSFHIVPMTNEHLTELSWLVEQGIASFKFFLSYIGQPIDSTSENYDLGFLYELMEGIAALDAARPTDRISLSLHCEDSDLLRHFAAVEEQRQSTTGIAQHAAKRPAAGEAVAIFRAAYLAQHLRVPINILHLSSAEAMRALTAVRSLWPDADIRGETTPHYLTLDSDAAGADLTSKVNPPIRGGFDQNALWDAVHNREIDWLATDHCCSSAAQKGPDLDQAVPGFGSGGLLYPTALTGALARGLPLGRVVELVSRAPAQAYGLYPEKGRIGVGADADIVIIDPAKERTVTAGDLHSHQDYSPFSGLRLLGWPDLTFQRGQIIGQDGAPVGDPHGAYLNRVGHTP